MSINTFGASYQAPINEPWPPTWTWGGPAYQPPPCDHCLCIDVPDSQLDGRDKAHMRCCHCRKLYVVTK